VSVPTMDGNVKVGIPPHTKTGKIPVEAKGIPGLGSRKKGSQYIILDVTASKKGPTRRCRTRTSCRRA
jgi:DnaJ-class molecular chaperone